MILLTSTSDVIKVVTATAVTIDVHASYMDYSSSAVVTAGRLNSAITTATTSTVVTAPASSTTRNVKTLNIKNIHASSSCTITLQHFDGTTTIELRKVTLLAGETLSYVEGEGFAVFDTSGQKKTTSAMYVDPRRNDFRLSGVTATPVMTADNASLSTVFLCSYTGNSIALYDGAQWQLVSPSSEPSLAVTGRTTDLPFDVFGYLSSGTVVLEFLNWTNATTRATGLTRVNGVWTKTGDATRRYLGSIRARSATTFSWVLAGTDTPVKMDLYNADNRLDFAFTLKASTDTWAYTIATWRQAQASANYQVDIMVGLQEQFFEAVLLTSSRNSTISIPRQCGIGFDVTNAISGTSAATANTVASIECSQMARICNQPAIGRHFYAWLEISTATGTCTWIGDDAALRLQSGMTGNWTC